MNPLKWLVTYIIIGEIIFTFIGIKLFWSLMPMDPLPLVEVISIDLLLAITGFIFSMAAGGILERVFLSTIEEKQVLIDLESKIIIDYPQRIYLWKRPFKKMSQGCRLISYAPYSFSLGMDCRPITPNPKVRELAYTIKGHFLGSIKQLMDFLKEFGYKHEEMDLEPWEKWQSLKKGVERFIAFHLYELNETLSTKLGEFYNPFNPQQQAEFKKLVLGFLTPRIENKGITITEISFGLEA